MTQKAHILSLLIVLSLLISACGGGATPVPSESAATEVPTALEVLDVTFAHGLTDEMAPVDPGNEFQPDETVYLSVKLKGVQKEGLVKAVFYKGDEQFAEATVDLAKEMEGLIVAVGGNTYVGFTLKPTSPLPAGDDYLAKVYVNDNLIGAYSFKVVGEATTAPQSTKAAEAPTKAEPTPESGGPTAGGEVIINALYYAFDPQEQKAIGGVSPVRIVVRPAAQKGELRVGFFEEEVAGTGNMWRTAGWMAVVVASQLLGIDPRDYEFSFSVGGRIDGPSAGTYMTVGVLAALLGDNLRDDVAMTGTINPDGTVGPVGGIPHKIEGAAEHGAKLVLIPAGQRYDFDQNKQKMVDLVEVGKKNGVEVREVSTVFEAYELLTGKPFPRPQVSSAAPQLPPRAFDRTRAKAQEWFARYQDARNRFNSLPEEITQFFLDGVAETDDLAQRSQNSLKEGLAAVAYQRSVEAAAQAQIWLLAAEIVERYVTGGLEATVDYLQSTQSTLGELDAVIDLLGTEQPRTANDYIALFDAYTSIGQAQGLVLIANNRLNTLVQQAGSMSEEEILGELVQLAAYYILARDFVQLARDSVDIGFGYGETVVEDPERVAAMEALFRRAAEANVRYFEATIVDQYAKNYGVHPDQMKNLFMNYDYAYLFTVASNYGTQALAGQLTDEAQQTSLILGNSISNYAQSASLVAKYYSLGAQLDENGNVTRIERERALADMLDLADRRAREAINMNGDEVPVMAVLYYETARLQRQGNPEDQMNALQSYWTATTLAQIHAYLVGITGQ